MTALDRVVKIAESRPKIPYSLERLHRAARLLEAWEQAARDAEVFENLEWVTDLAMVALDAVGSDLRIARKT